MRRPSGSVLDKKMHARSTGVPGHLAYLWARDKQYAGCQNIKVVPHGSEYRDIHVTDVTPEVEFRFESQLKVHKVTTSEKDSRERPLRQ